VASTLTRRPLPALIALLALLVLTGLVWWRVLHRGDGSKHASTHCSTSASTPAPPPSTSALPAPTEVTVQVLNSTSRAGIASKARTTLIGLGFKSPRPATNDGPRVRVRGVAEIRYAPAEAKAAKLLSLYFPGAALVANPKPSTTVVVSLGDKYVRVATAQAVTTALQKQHLTTASPTPTSPTSSPSC
jgi:LytR cell envelope-related transcriptional attenuator